MSEADTLDVWVTFLWLVLPERVTVEFVSAMQEAGQILLEANLLDLQ